VTRNSGGHRRALLPLFLAVPLIVSGCAGSLFKTKVAPPTLYLLSVAPPAVAPAAAAAPAPAAAAPAAAAPAAELKADLAVLKPRVRAGLDNDRIAVLYPDRRLDYFADARWSGPLDEVVQDLVVQLFHSRAGLRNVSGDASAFASAYWLEIEVADFQAEYAAGGPADGGAPPNVHVHLLARIGSSADRRIIARFEADARQPATANRLGAIVDAYNRAANQVLMQIAASCAMALATETKGP
jgi:cholesterol transport system auxiliary component